MHGESGTDGHKRVAGIGPAIVQDPASGVHRDLPQKPDSRNQWLDHQKTVMDILRKTQSEYNIDPDRIYLTGLSREARTWADRLIGTFAGPWSPSAATSATWGDTMMPQSIAVRFQDRSGPFTASGRCRPLHPDDAGGRPYRNDQAGMRDLVPIKLTPLPRCQSQFLGRSLPPTTTLATGSCSIAAGPTSERQIDCR